MAIDLNGDWVDALIDEQARKNNMLEEGDINTLVTDFQFISGETVGFQADSLATSITSPPHNWGDGQSPWGFFQWA